MFVHHMKTHLITTDQTYYFSVNWFDCCVLLCRKLLQFGVLEGLIRRVQKYPVQLLTTEASFSRVPQQQQQPQRQLSKHLDGSQCYDEISCHTG